ncbi:HNH endonuclease [Brevibacillus sp. NRS-1366]|uniref:HNH endonuclease n=1 Tax=Brevibacillus sp. NRS-1366 TaxID=3233899 RepID=UPI003D1A206A
MKEIHLEEGVVLVDDEDYEYLSECYDLYISKDEYVQCRIKKKYRHSKMGLWSSLSLHKLLMNPERMGRNVPVDHIDGNGLNNQKSNLRVCSHSDNMRNRKSHIKELKGVRLHKCGSYEVYINLERGGKTDFLGTFTDEVAAANCYNFHAKEHFGEFANLNDVKYMPKDEWESYSTKNMKTSKYRGVSLNNATGRYLAQCWDGKKNIRIGEFENEEDAAIAYDIKAYEIKGNKAKLNFRKGDTYGES